MHLTRLDIYDVRNLSGVHMECSPGINIISGKNAAGKTAILEAIHLLSRVSSFRTPRVADVIQYGKERLSITASLKNGGINNIITGLEKGKQHTRIRFNGLTVNKRSEQAQNIPLLTISPESHRLLSGAPRERRHWLDWSMFHVEPAYMDYWQNYHNALRQRNALLRQGAGDDLLSAWEETMAIFAVKLRESRKAYIDKLVLLIREAGGSDFGEIGIDLKSEAQGLQDARAALKLQRNTDAAAGFTRNGAHREDVVFDINGRDAGRALSSGEGKLFVLFLFISQALEYRQKKQQRPIMLIDDLPAELDEEARNRILAELQKHGLQLFITTNSPDAIVKNSHQKWFHVEQGRIVRATD